ncbi:MAG: hypothetical protein MMC23_008162 [Stictis urceolatum]|nr:hypothetical protein [Stictis urceolata]
MKVFVAIPTVFLAGVSALGGMPYSVLEDGRKSCTVKATGNQTDDTPTLLKAFQECGNNAKIIFPETENYYIATKLNPVLNNVEIEWRGQWTLSDNLDYWRNNSYPIAFQNHHAGFVITGDYIRINGYGTGGINGNGDAWYTAEAGNTQPGRPMPFVFWNVSEVFVSSFFIKQPPLWSLNIMNGTNMQFHDIYVNATALSAPYGSNWVQNTDGFDTMDAQNILLDGLTYQGGDDCIAIKPRSHDITVRNVTCHGGNGIAIGSLGQYLEDSSVENVLVSNVTVIRINEDLHNSAYIKTWVGALVPQSGYESAGQPRGGGWGVVNNVRFENFVLDGVDSGPSINQDSGNNGSYSGTSKMAISNIAFVNFTGTVSGSNVASVSCSNVHPCYGITYEGFDVKPASGSGTSSCKYIAPGGVHGLNGTGCTYDALANY